MRESSCGQGSDDGGRRALQSTPRMSAPASEIVCADAKWGVIYASSPSYCLNMPMIGKFVSLRMAAI